MTGTGPEPAPEPPPKPLPALDDDTRAFWTSGADGVLRFPGCTNCGALAHPPQPVCRTCHADTFELRDVAPTGVVIGVTVNHQQWNPVFPPPSLIATIALDEDPRVRLVTNLVDVAFEDAAVGMRVEAVFEHVDDVWIPYFRPTGETVDTVPGDEIAPTDHARHLRPPTSSRRYEDDIVISGIGMSDIGRRLMRPPLTLAIDAITAAVADAGLELADIDGLATYPGGSSMGGYSEGGTTAVEDALALRPTWHNGAGETFGGAGSLVEAMLAVSAGLCNHVVCFRTLWQATYAAQLRARDPGGANPYGFGAGSGGGRVPGFSGPYGVGSVANNMAMLASNHFHQYGTTRETLGWIALNQRRNAALNPNAIYRDPLTMDDYLSARMISTPLGLYDCDVPADGAIAVIVSHRDTIPDLRSTPVMVEAVGSAMTERMRAEQSTSTHEPQTLGPSAHLWTRTDLRPTDVDVGLLYDGFTFNCLSWLEGLGFCAIGEGKDFLDRGTNIALDGVLPLNPHGGQLSAGRTHGMGLVYEAVTQLRGDAGERQVRDASTAVVTSGGFNPGTALLFRRD